MSQTERHDKNGSQKTIHLDTSHIIRIESIIESLQNEVLLIYIILTEHVFPKRTTRRRPFPYSIVFPKRRRRARRLTCCTVSPPLSFSLIIVSECIHRFVPPDGGASSRLCRLSPPGPHAGLRRRPAKDPAKSASAKTVWTFSVARSFLKKGVVVVVVVLLLRLLLPRGLLSSFASKKDCVSFRF